MGYQTPFPAALEQVEYVSLYFHLEINSDFDLPVLGLLQLRRELLQALKTFPTQGGNNFTSQLKGLLQPDLPDNPVLLQQIQKPAPALILSPDISQYGLIEAKQRIVLPVLFIGSGINAVDAFVGLMQHLGTQGLYHGSGQFLLEGVEAEDGSGVRSMLWFAGKQTSPLTPPVSNLSWWLERQNIFADSIQFEISSPLRLLRQGKPLFKAEFVDIFPHLLRRVTALLAGYAGVGLIDAPARLISLAGRVQSLENKLLWKDWRTLNMEHRKQNLGGLMGHLRVAGDELGELIWILQLGSLFNFGKGAAYGAGQYCLDYS